MTDVKCEIDTMLMLSIAGNVLQWPWHRIS